MTDLRRAAEGAGQAASVKNGQAGSQQSFQVGSHSNFGRNPDRHDVPDTPQIESVQKWLLRYSVEHLQGPEGLEYEKDELVVLCLLYNGRHYLKSFIEHYFSLGAKHIVFMDNGSTDGTVEVLEEYENVTVLRSTLFFKRYQLLMKRYLIERFGRERWTLLVDVDELFDYPYSDVVSLRSLLGYLNEHSYTAVVTYMLDMFPEEPLAEAGDGEDIPLERHRFYDISDMTVRGYHSVEGTNNALSNEEVVMMQGGVQRRLFGLHPMLVKHALVFLDGEVRPVDMSEHWASNARVADFTGVLFHYKLSGKLYALVEREVNERRYINPNSKYDKYHKVLEENPKLEIKDANSRELESVNDLVGNGFLAISPEYMDLVQEKSPAKLMEAFFAARCEIDLRQQNTNKKTRKIKQLEDELAKERQKTGTLQQQLDGVLASKSWRALDLINRLRKKALARVRGR